MDPTTRAHSDPRPRSDLSVGPAASRSKSARGLRRSFLAAAALALGLTVAAGGAPSLAAPSVQDAPAQLASEGRTYELVDTWRDKPWTLTAGRYGWTADISSTPEGRTYVLDNRMPGAPTAARPPAIHVLAADGSPVRVFPVPGQEEANGPHFAQRMDTGVDGTAHVLSSGEMEWQGDVLFTHFRVDEVDATGQRVGGFDVTLETLGDELPNWRRYVDIAVREDGRVYLLRMGINPWCVEPDDPPISIGPGENPIYSVDVFSPQGTLLESLTPPPMLIPNGVDVAPDGRVFILNRIPPPCSGQGGPGEPLEPPSFLPGTPELLPPLPPGLSSWPAASRPDAGSVAANDDAGLLQDTDPDRIAIPGVIILNPDHSYREIVPWYGGEDVAVGPAGAYVSRNVEVFHLVDMLGASAAYVEDVPTIAGPTGHIFAGFLRRIAFTLDVPADGRLLAGMNHCYYQGFVEVADPRGRPAAVRLVGGLDAPELEGPAYPVRVAAAEELAVLLGRMRITGARPAQAYELTNMTTEAQTVQRWPLAGSGPGSVPVGGILSSQVGLCPDTDLWFGTDNWLTRDIAIDGDTIYTMDQELLQKRPDDGWPSWTYWPGEILEDPDEASFLGAVDADEGLVAVLDVGAESIVIVNAAGERVAHWPVAAGDEAPLPVDVALDGNRLYVADRARGRIVTRDLDGAVLGDFATHDGPESIAVGPTGDILMIGEGGYGLHYTPEGDLVASWALPDRDALVRDVAVGPDHRVYVNYAKTALFRSDLIGQKQEVIRDGGIWVFERAGRPAPPPPVTQGCVPRPDKWAHEPRRFPLGGTVDVSLTVDGWCPGTYDDAQLLFLMDTSRSMGFDDSLSLAKTAALTMIDGLDPEHAEAALVTFDAGPTLAQPFTRDLAAVRSAVARQGADGDTRVTGALEAAHLELTGERADPDARRLLVVLTDGVFYDQPFPPPVIDDIHAAGVEVHVLVFPTDEFGIDDQAAMERVAGDLGRVHTAPSEGATAQLTRDLTGYQPEDGLFETITIVDKVPENMKYIEESAEPPATWNQDERTLTWVFGVTPASVTLEMTYTLEPLEVGTWPTNVWARGPYLDALGKRGQVVFPVPEVEVYELELIDTVYLPWSGHGLCLKPRAADIVLVMDASSSMLHPAAGGGTKIEAARAAATQLVDGLRLGDTADRVSVVEFYNDAHVVTPLSGKRAPVLDGLARLAPDPSRQGTRIDLGLRAARVALGARRGTALPVVVLLSDGLQNPGGNGPVLTEMAVLSGRVPELLVYTIGLGDQIDEALLRDALASSPDRYYASPTAEQLAAIYAEISERLQCEGQ